jgi:uncharacterized protein (TIGR03067 family)
LEESSVFHLLPALGLALVAAAPLPKDAKPPDAPSIVGEWLGETVTGHGRTERYAETKSTLTYSFSADGELVIRNGPTWSKCKYATDPKKEPATVDLGSTLAIYKIEKDTLTLCCYGPSLGKPVPTGRPSAFEAPVRSPLLLITFKRVEKKKE